MNLKSSLVTVDADELARALFNESRDAIVLVDPSRMACVDINPSAVKLLAVSTGDLSGRSVSDLIDETDAAGRNEIVAACRNLTSMRGTITIRTQGTEASFRATCSVRHLTTQSRPMSMLTICPISSETAANSALSAVDTAKQDIVAENNQLTALLHDIDAIVWECSLPSWQFTYVSPQAESILGYPVSQWLEEPNFWVNHVHEDDRENSIEYCESCSMLGINHSFDYRAIAADGRCVWLRDVVHVVKDADGHPKGLRGVMVDITTQRESEMALRESEDERERAERIALLMKVEVGLDGRWQRIPPTLCDFLGYTYQELSAGVCSDVTHIEDRAEDGRQLKRLIGGEINSFEREKRYVRKDGSVVWAYINCSLVRTRSGEPKKFLTYIKDITSRKISDEALRQSEQRYRSVVNALSEGVSLYGRDMKLLAHNESATRILGLTDEQMQGRTMIDPRWQTFREDSSPWMPEEYPASQTLRHGTPLNDQIMGVRHTDGQIRWVSINTRPLFDDDGQQPSGVVVSFEDVTDRRLASERLRRSKEELESAQRRAGLGSWEIHSEGGLVKWSEETFRLYYRDPAAGPPATSEEFLQTIHVDDRYLMLKVHARIWKTDEPIENFDLRTNPQNGPQRWLDASVFRVNYKDRNGFFVAGTVQDVTRRRIAEDSLRRSEQSLARAQRMAHIGSWQLDLETGEMSGSVELCRILGVPPATVVASPEEYRLQFVHEDDRDLLRVAHDQALQSGRVQDCIQYRIRRKSDGAIRYVRAEAEFVRSDDGTLLRQFGTLQDITNRRRAQAELSQTRNKLSLSEAKFQTIVETTKEWIWEVDTDGQHIYSNPAIEHILGYRPEEIVNRPAIQMMHDDDKPVVSKQLALHIAERTGWSQWVVRWKHKDGSTRILESNAVPILDADGDLQGFRGADRDITARVEAEEQVRRHQQSLAHVSRLSTMGEMVAGIAHEINQPLTAISAFAEASRLTVAKQSPALSEKVQSSLQQISDQAIRCGDIIRRLRSYVKKNDEVRQPIDVGTTIRSSIALLQNELRHRSIGVDCLLPDSIPSVLACEVQLQQVLVNLLKNAIDATNDVNAPQIHITVVCADERVSITIRDNGSGIPGNQRDRLFDAFFTTKSDGLGMGLAISKSIIESQEGRLMVSPDVSSGAKFIVELPVNTPDTTAKHDE